MPASPPEPLSGSLAAALVRAAEDAWNRRDLDAVARGHRIDCHWRDRADFLWGREQIRAHLVRKWRREIEFRTVYELWAMTGPQLAVRMCCEFRSDSGTWFRAYGTEAWECERDGLVIRRFASVNEHPIEEHERVLRWIEGERPGDYPTLTELGL